MTGRMHDPTVGKAEAILIVDVSRHDLQVEVAPGVLIDRRKFASVTPIDSEHHAELRSESALRARLVEEQLAAATERSDHALTRREVTEVTGMLGTELREHAETRRRYRLAVESLIAIREHGGRHLDNQSNELIDTLLGGSGSYEGLVGAEYQGKVGHEQPEGSLVNPCRAEHVVTEPDEECGCGDFEPDGCDCTVVVDRQPCVLRAGHHLIPGGEAHRTPLGNEFTTEDA